jgi:hypothetical protein
VQTPMMIAFLESKRQQLVQEERIGSELKQEVQTPSRRTIRRSVYAILVLVLLLLALMSGSVRSTLAAPAPPCDRVALRNGAISSSILVDYGPGPILRIACGAKPTYPPPLAAEDDQQSFWDTITEFVQHLRDVVAALLI